MYNMTHGHDQTATGYLIWYLDLKQIKQTDQQMTLHFVCVNPC